MEAEKRCKNMCHMHSKKKFYMKIDWMKNVLVRKTLMILVVILRLISFVKGWAFCTKSRSLTGIVPKTVPNLTKFKNTGRYTVLQNQEIWDSLPSVPVLVPKINIIPGTGTDNVNSVHYSGLTFDQIQYSWNREWYRSVVVPSYVHP